MYLVYVDTSCAAKVLLQETETARIKKWLEESGFTFVSSRLLETEIRRVAAREGIEQTAATALLARFDLFDVAQTAFRGAGMYPDPLVRSLDALHLTMAALIGAQAMATYDDRMAEAAQQMGLAVVLPDAA
ncbi:type II toxin-antitoxin system VapC family toxin [Nocardioides sp. Kera G14]|uniref:type II toxin-antitoxin system VapC family toxin n=1 Tax=Nocardioides sp. Kera G14 TaxID=2884264 RepID=UPI001D12722D|nr:type II toxin-antitoxin system VapC family toxin [Nocardioides sp. Kera G14]UDY23022.1 type II toxin-antitoxin system VapC family toxin [Nocardioides sp. Kera G14]